MGAAKQMTEQSPNPAEAQNSEPTGDDDKLINKLEEEIKQFDKQWSSKFEQIGINRQWCRSLKPNQSDPDTGELARQRAPIIAATHRTLNPNLYAKNPDVSGRPRPQVGNEGYTQAKMFGETLENVVQYQFKRGRLKRAVNKVLRSNESAGIGWIKVSYQRDVREQPHIRNQIKDAQDNLRRLVRMQEELSDGVDDPAAVEQLTDLIFALNKQVEVVRAEGVVFDFVPVEHIKLHPSVTDLEEYERSPTMCQDIYMDVDEYKDTYGLTEVEIKRVSRFKYDDDKEHYERITNHDTQSDDDYSDMVCVRELWDSRTNTVYTWARGAKSFCRDPWVPETVGERWYPFFGFGLFFTDGFSWPQTLTEELIPVQEDMDLLAQQEVDHKEMNKPGMFFAKDKIDPDTIKRVEHIENRDLIGIDMSNVGNMRFTDLIAPIPSVPIAPGQYDDTKLMQRAQWTSGAGDAARGGVVTNKTLGEAEIQQSHLSSRMGYMADSMEDFMSEIAVYTSQLCLLNMQPKLVLEVAGDQAYWPAMEMDRRQIYLLLDVEIQAGSTGKPDEVKQKQQFMEATPLWMQLTQAVMELRAQGIDDELNPHYQWAKLMLSRFDERMDIDELMPNPFEQQMGMGQPGNQMIMGPDGQPIPPELMQQGGLPQNVVPIQQGMM